MATSSRTPAPPPKAHSPFARAPTCRTRSTWPRGGSSRRTRSSGVVGSSQRGTRKPEGPPSAYSAPERRVERSLAFGRGCPPCPCGVDRNEGAGLEQASDHVGGDGGIRAARRVRRQRAGGRRRGNRRDQPDGGDGSDRRNRRDPGVLDARGGCPAGGLLPRLPAVRAG